MLARLRYADTKVELNFLAFVCRYTLMLQCWRIDPNERATATQALEQLARHGSSRQLVLGRAWDEQSHRVTIDEDDDESTAM
jgi:hypothetical protein